MRMKGKKVIFNREDTFSLDATLEPILSEAFKKFRDVIIDQNEKGGCLGVPMWAYEELGIDIDGCTKAEEEDAFEYYIHTINQVIYAFDSSNEPDISDYDFTYDFEVSFRCTNEEERDRYNNDTALWEKRCTEGRKLCFEKWRSWWW